MTSLRLAIVGDVHLAFGPEDIATFEAGHEGRAYDHVLFVGDLAGYSAGGALRVARQIAKLRVPTLVIPGNHDAMTAPQMFAEIVPLERAVDLLTGGEERRLRQLDEALGAAERTGYRVHALSERLALVAARPHSFGGPRLSFRPYLSRAFGVADLEQSAARLCALVDSVTASDIVFLAHNGPTGLGARRHDIWGCDFRRGGGDFGDPDLRVAIDHARARGKRVLAVAAGHMHRMLRGGGPDRVPMARDEAGTIYVNAAQVPRVFHRDGQRVRHHVALVIDGGRAEAEDIFVPSTPAR